MRILILACLLVVGCCGGNQDTKGLTYEQSGRPTYKQPYINTVQPNAPIPPEQDNK